MRKLYLEEWISLDGYAADKDGSLDFFTSLTGEQSKFSDWDQLQFLEKVDSFILGRKTYELFINFWPTATIDQEPIADKLNGMEKLICSNSIQSAPWGKWKKGEVIHGNAVDAIRDLKKLPGKDLVLWGSISLAQQLLQANLVDEMRIMVCPILTGGGRPLFTPGSERNKLTLLSHRSYETGVVFLNYMTNPASR